MAEQEQAHAIDIHICAECPYVGEHTPEDETAACTHPRRLAIEKLDIKPQEPPPTHCPHRFRATLLRVTVPQAQKGFKR